MFRTPVLKVHFSFFFILCQVRFFRVTLLFFIHYGFYISEALAHCKTPIHLQGQAICLIVWPFPQDPSGKDEPTSSYAVAGRAV